MDTIRAGQDSPRINPRGSREASQAAGSPMQTHIAWRMKIA